MATPRLGAPELVSAQATPETTVNEIVRYLEQGASLFIVKDQDIDDPPGSPADGDAYIVATASPSGAWTGWGGRLAFYMNSAWEDVTPIEGTFAYVQDENELYRYDGAAWVAFGSGGVSIEDDGSAEASSVTTLNFTGDGVTASDAGGGQVDINIPGAAGGGSEWALVNTSGAEVTGQTFTITIASPGVVTLNSHGFAADTPLLLTTTGALPTGLTAGNVYYVRSPTANTFELSATSGGASINTSGSQSGTHTATRTTTWTFSANVGNVDVTGLDAYNELMVLARGVSASASGLRQLFLSTNNGSSFYTTSGDYQIVQSDGAETAITSFVHSTSTSAARTLAVHILNLKGAIKVGEVQNTTGVRTMFVADAKDVNAIRLANNAGGNLTAGSLYVYAR